MESVMLMIALLKQQRDHRKEFLVQNYDLIKVALELLKSELCPRLVFQVLDLITFSVVRDTELLLNNIEGLNPEGPETVLQNVELPFLLQFFQYDGIDIYEGLRGRFADNQILLKKICWFHDKYFDVNSQDVYQQHVSSMLTMHAH